MGEGLGGSRWRSLHGIDQGVSLWPQSQWEVEGGQCAQPHAMECII